jgi:hypothetical protein
MVYFSIVFVNVIVCLFLSSIGNLNLVILICTDHPLLYLYGWDGRGENVHSINLIPNIFLALLFLVKLVTTLSSLQNCFAP